MKRLWLATCIVLLAFASPSYGADIPHPIYKAPAYAPPVILPFSWSGFYLGLNGGYAWGKADLSNSSASFTTDSTDGWLIGATGGYNYQLGYIVLGLEGDIDYALIKGNGSNTVTCGSGSCEVKDTWFATVRGRLGYAAWDHWLPYITGGGAFAGLKVTPTSGSSSTNTASGWTVGAGIEYAFMHDWSAKLEYLYADLGPATCDASVCGLSTDIEPKLNIVRAGVNYHF